MSEAAYSAGTLAGTGSFRCDHCGFTVALNALDEIPTCPTCDSESFTRASMFIGDAAGSSTVEPIEEDVDWLEDVREQIETDPGCYLSFHDDERLTVFPITGEWTRIGRSLAADIRLDDPTVSRRHALLVMQDDDVRLLDDRSLNGVFVNGERVEWCPLRDGDRIVIGKYELFYIDSRPVAEKASRAESHRVVA